MEGHRRGFGVEPMCKVLQIAPSTWHARAAARADPDTRSKRAKADDVLSVKIRRIFEGNFGVYGVRKVWRQLQRDGETVGRCAVARLMKAMDLKGVIRGKPVETTIQDKKQPCLLDKVNRAFRADRPNKLWVADFTYVRTWAGFVLFAAALGQVARCRTPFVIDVFARRIVGWKASRIAPAQVVLDARKQAVRERRPAKGDLIHHSDRGSQYLSITDTERLVEVGIEPSVGSVGDRYDNAMAETVNGLFKAEVIHRGGPGRTCEQAELATLKWVD